jgi:ATP synthase F1 delta subunit
MKITNEQYAKLLYEALKTSSENERKTLIKGVADLIKQNGDISKLSDIENRYRIIKQKESGQLEGVVYSANKLEEKELQEITKAVATKKDISEKLISLKNEINPDLKGGFIVRFENEILDGSLDSKINKVKQALAS